MSFKKLNNIVGWFVFLIATIVYVLTLETTVSWWDCGEYISTAYKLQVGHPPGAPLFQMLGRFFSLFAFGDVTSTNCPVGAVCGQYLAYWAMLKHIFNYPKVAQKSTTLILSRRATQQIIIFIFCCTELRISILPSK